MPRHLWASPGHTQREQYVSEENTMALLVEELERRDFPRVRRRLPCSLLIAGHCHSATVRDLSANGFFVETDADLRIGSGVIVTVSGPDGERFLLETYVPRYPAFSHHRPYTPLPRRPASAPARR